VWQYPLRNITLLVNVCTRYKNQAVILSIRITFVAPWHVFLHTFLTSILRVGCPLQTTGLVVARARLQREAGCVDLQHKFNSRHFVETVTVLGFPQFVLRCWVCLFFRMLLDYIRSKKANKKMSSCMGYRAKDMWYLMSAIFAFRIQSASTIRAPYSLHL